MLVCSTRQTMWSPWRIPWGCVGIGFQFNSEAGRNSGGMGQQQGNPIFCLYSKDEEVYTDDEPTSDNSVTIAGASWDAGLGSIPFSTIGTDLEQFVWILSLLITFLQFFTTYLSTFRWLPLSICNSLSISAEVAAKPEGKTSSWARVSVLWTEETLANRNLWTSHLSCNRFFPRKDSNSFG